MVRLSLGDAMPEDTVHGEIGRRVRQAIKKSGRTQAEVARGLGMSEPALSRLLSQGRNLKLPQLQRIAALCGISLEELIGKTAQGPVEAVRVFRELVLLEVPAAVAYDLATGRGGLLSPEERDRLNAAGDRLRQAFQEGQGPENIADLFADETKREQDPPDL
jgi:transcriptional regulator with XRE-family HTH domain